MTERKGFASAKRDLDRRILSARRALDPTAEPMPAWRLHHLRSIFSTGMRELGVDHETVKELMSHQIEEQEGAAGVYNHARLRRLQRKEAALREWADYVEKLVGANVVTLADRRTAS